MCGLSERSIFVAFQREQYGNTLRHIMIPRLIVVIHKTFRNNDTLCRTNSRFGKLHVFIFGQDDISVLEDSQLYFIYCPLRPEAPQKLSEKASHIRVIMCAIQLSPWIRYGIRLNPAGCKSCLVVFLTFSQCELTSTDTCVIVYVYLALSPPFRNRYLIIIIFFICDMLQFPR